MEKNLSDYLHLYLGCEVRTNDHEMGNRTHYGRIGTFLGFADVHRLECRLGFRSGPEGRCGIFILKPLLRPLSGMNPNECQIFYMNYFNGSSYFHPKKVPVAIGNIKRILDGDDYETGDFTKVVSMVPWLLRCEFDLFGLIEAGLAIDKTKLTAHA